MFTSWRIHGTEYYDTQYNLYRDGKLVNPEPLDVSNFTDPEGTASSTYTVKAVVRDEEQDACEPAEVWDKQYLTIPMGKMYSRRGTDITLDYFLNDATAADLDGDGEMEIIVKRLHNNDGLFLSGKRQRIHILRGLQVGRHAAVANRHRPQHDQRR